MNLLRIGVFLIFSTLVFAQEDSEGQKIYEQCKDAGVDIKTKIQFENGEEVTYGGSGFFLPEKDGSIGTCAHVVKIKDDQLVIEDFFGKVTIKVKSYEYSVVVASKNRKYKAELVGVNVYSDTAILKALEIEPADYSVCKIGDSKKLKVGERIYALGVPYGLSGSFTAGKISGLNRHLDLEYLENYIQSDISINSGNSGGPLINSKGEVVGINVRGATQGGNLVLSVPMNLFRPDQLKTGEVSLPWFGMEAMVNNFPRMGIKDKPRFQDLAELHKKTGMDDPESLVLLAKLTDANNPDIESWAVVTTVEESKTDGKFAPAKIGGLKKGDLIKKVNGNKVQNGMDIRLTVLEIPLGKEFEIELVRIEKGGMPKNLTVKVTLQKKP